MAPENENIVVHSMGALNIPIATVAIFLISLATLRESRMLATVGIGVVLLGTLGTALSISAQFFGPELLLGLGAGGLERLAGYPANAWLVAAGILAITEAPGSARR